MTGNRNPLIDGLLKLHIALCLVFIFAPIAGSFVFSLNSDRFPSLPLGSFSTEWYRLIWEDPLVWAGFFNTLLGRLRCGDCYIAGLWRRLYRLPLQLHRQASLPGAGPAAADHPSGDHGAGDARLPFPRQPVGQCGLGDHRPWRDVQPFAMAIIRLRLSQMDPDLEAAAWNLGGNEWVTMRHVIIPLHQACDLCRAVHHHGRLL